MGRCKWILDMRCLPHFKETISHKMTKGLKEKLANIRLDLAILKSIGFAFL